MPSKAGKRISCYFKDEIAEALEAYKRAGSGINLSRTAQLAVLEKFIEVERARRTLGEPFVYSPEQLARMKRSMERD